MKFGNARDILIELLQAGLNGGDLERVGKPTISVSGLLGLGSGEGLLVLMTHGNDRKLSRGRNMKLPRRRSRTLIPGLHPTVRP